jgi:predicted negative regulator of RcsB-dependent stress response
MNAYVNEQEQVEALKQWWKNNGTSLIVIVVLAIVFSFGWRYWQQYRNKHEVEASLVYDKLMMYVVQDGDNSLFNQQVAILKKDYRHTPYATLAELFVAKRAMAAGDFATAKQTLESVMNHAPEDYLRQIARLRLARILLSQNKANEALSLLYTIDDNAYLAAVEVIKGDSYKKLNQLNLARNAYMKALTAIPPDDAMLVLVKMKLNQLPATTAEVSSSKSKT